jgi:hypothetical protein
VEKVAQNFALLLNFQNTAQSKQSPILVTLVEAHKALNESKTANRGSTVFKEISGKWKFS